MRTKIINLLLLLASFTFISFIKIQDTNMVKKLFGTMPDGENIYSYTMTNSSGMSATIINYGATVVKLEVPDRNGKVEDIILGYDSLSSYMNGSSYFGGIVGRFGNRINKGKFTLDGKEYQLAINSGGNHLHGGDKGFNKRVWKEKELSDNALEFTYISQDGEENYPGKLTITVTYISNR